MTLSRRRFLKGVAGITAIGVVRPAATATRSNELALHLAVRSPWLANQVALTRGNTLFLGLPRHDIHVATPSVAKRLADGSLAPFPGNGWNKWQPGQDGRDAFVYVNGLHVFDDDTVWCVDQGTAGGRKTSLPGAQKLVQLDSDSGAVLRILRFDARILPPGAQINDVRKFGNTLYISDSGLGALIVHDLASGRTWRRLSGYKRLQASPVAIPEILKKKLKGRPFHPPDSDMIEVTADGRWLYWAAPTGPFYRIETALLRNDGLTDDTLAAHIQHVADIPFTSGCSMDTVGNLYLSETGTGHLTLLSPGGQRRVLASSADFLRPDGSFISADRKLYVSVKTPPPSLAGTQTPYPVYAVSLPSTFEGIPLGSAVSGKAVQSIVDRR